jgi:hypothetical protein
MIDDITSNPVALTVAAENTKASDASKGNAEKTFSRTEISPGVFETRWSTGYGGEIVIVVSGNEITVNGDPVSTETAEKK